MIRFDPDSPWKLGQLITVDDNGMVYQVIITHIEYSDDGMETQYRYAPVLRIGGDQ